MCDVLNAVVWSVPPSPNAHCQVTPVAGELTTKASAMPVVAAPETLRTAGSGGVGGGGGGGVRTGGGGVSGGAGVTGAWTLACALSVPAVAVIRASLEVVTVVEA